MKKERVRRVKRKILCGRLRDSLRLRESLNPTIKGIPTERPETTTSCGLNPTVQGIPTERLETTTSCGLNPNVKGIPTKRLETTTSCGLNPTVKGIPTEKARDNDKLQPEFPS
jgi:hypothetical protein